MLELGAEKEASGVGNCEEFEKKSFFLDVFLFNFGIDSGFRLRKETGFAFWLHSADFFELSLWISIIRYSEH